MDRRTFLMAGSSAFGLSLARLSTAAPFRLQPTFAESPFTLGVASGDPDPDGVVLWTRLAPEPLTGGGMPPEAFEVDWRVATDDGMRDVVRQGSAADVTMGLPGSSEEQSEMIVDFGDRTDRGATGSRTGSLLDGDGGRESLDPVDIRFLHQIQVLPGVRREGLDVSSLALGVDGVEDERGFA